MEGAARSVPSELFDHVLAAYPRLDAKRAEARALGNGLLHESFAVTSPAGEFVAQRVSPIFSPAIHDNIRAVARHLAARGCATVTLCETASGALYVDLPGGARWRLLERLPGATFETCSGAAQARSAGAQVAAFHAALSDFAAPLAPMGIPYHDTPRYLADLAEAVARRHEHPRHADVAALADRVFAAMEELRPPAHLPHRVVHGDLKFSNVMFAGASGRDRDRATALIDLDTLCRLPVYYDIGDAWRSWTNRRAEDVPEAEFDLEIFAATADGYLAHPGLRLDDAERRSLDHAFELLTLEVCARFTTDVLNECYFAWDPTRFPSAAEHNWSRARGQWSLYQQALATKTERLELLRS
jgi:Ser/Thr protein kinase RdoA (MazF antagonist)